MDLDEAFKRAVQKYYSGTDFTGYTELNGKPSKYVKSSLDGLEDLVKPKKVSDKGVMKNAGK